MSQPKSGRRTQALLFFRVGNFLNRYRLQGPFRIPIIVSMLFLLVTIYPVLPIMGLYLDGGLLGIVEDLFFDKGEKGATQTLLLNWIVNAGLSTYFFILFVSVKKPWLKVLFSILTITFLYYFIVFIFMVKYEATMS